MQRRMFIRVVGGGAVAAAAVGGAGALALRDSYPDQAIEAWNGPGKETDPRRRALAYAITAPNPHNLQPWLADLREPDVITIRTDKERTLPATDPQGRQIIVGHGAFLELLVIALAEHGMLAKVLLWPEGELGPDLSRWDERPIARVELSPGGVADPLFSQVLLRRTPKVDFDIAQPVAPQTLRKLLDHPIDSSVHVGGTVDMQRVAALRDLCWESAKVELQTPETVMESVRLLRIGPGEINRHRDGISVNAAMPRLIHALGMFDRSQPPAQGTAPHEQMLARFRGHSFSAMGFAWITTPGNTRTHQVQAGRAYLRLQLNATALRLGMHPMSQALQEFDQMRPHYVRVPGLVAEHDGHRSLPGTTVQMLLRLGYPRAAIQPTPRRPLSAFIA